MQIFQHVRHNKTQGLLFLLFIVNSNSQSILERFAKLSKKTRASEFPARSIVLINVHIIFWIKDTLLTFQL